MSFWQAQSLAKTTFPSIRSLLDSLGEIKLIVNKAASAPAALVKTN